MSSTSRSSDEPVLLDVPCSFERRWIVASEQAAQAWDISAPSGAIRIPYARSALDEAAALNRRGRANWRLIYCFGLTLSEQLRRIGTDETQALRFREQCLAGWEEDDRDADGHLKGPWLNRPLHRGWLLIDFTCRFGGVSWSRQAREIDEVPNAERAHEASVTEAIISMFRTHGELLLPDWYHWGHGIDAHDLRVIVGNSTAGIVVAADVSEPASGFGDCDQGLHPNQGICLLWRPEAR